MSIKYSVQRFTDSSFVRLESDNYHIAFPGPSSGEEGLPSVSPMNEKTTWTKRPKNGYTDRSTQPYPTTFPPQATAREREEDQTKKRTSINKTTRPVHTGRRPLAGHLETASDSQVGCIEGLLDTWRQHRTAKWAAVKACWTPGDGIGQPSGLQ